MDAKGQSILEVVIVLPFLFTLVLLLFRFNMGIQMAINNVQHARAQIYVLAGNSPEYPRIEFRSAGLTFFKRRMDLMILGVADPTAIDEGDYSGDVMPPIPQIQRVGNRSLPGASSEPGEGMPRTEVRVRETAAICTQSNGVGANLAFSPRNIPALGARRWPFGNLPCQYEGTWIGGLNE